MKFDSEARRAFEFLLPRGFSVVSTGDGEIRFESDRVFVDVWRDPYGYDLDLRVGLTAEPAERLSLAELELVSGQKESPVVRPESIAEMREGLVGLARTLDAAAPGILDGDRQAFDQVRVIRAAYTQRFTSSKGPASAALNDE